MRKLDVLLALSAVLLVSCQRDLGDWEFFESGLREEARDQLDPARLEEARRRVEEQRQLIDRLILETQWHADALRFLGDAYFRRRMFAPATQVYAKALEILPDSYSLWYRLALAHAQLATLELDPDGRKARSRLAARAYERALALEPNHAASLYGLAIIQVFELNNPREALPLLDRLLNLETRNTRALFVRARARFETGDIEGAVKDYDAILRYSTDPAEQESARRNRSAVLGAAR